MTHTAGSGDPRIVLIAAMDRRRAIGRDGALPWHLPDDLRRFKQLTLGKPVLMGRKTAQSIGRALPGRTNLVMTRGAGVTLKGMHIVATLRVALAHPDATDARELCVIGGGEIYALALPCADRLHLTHVHTDVQNADAFFPDFAADAWREISRKHHPADARHAFDFDFVDYERV